MRKLSPNGANVEINIVARESAEKLVLTFRASAYHQKKASRKLEIKHISIFDINI